MCRGLRESRPRTNWRSTVNKDVLRMGITWEEVEVAAQNKSEWRRSVGQCIHLDAGCIKVKVNVSIRIVIRSKTATDYPELI